MGKRFGVIHALKKLCNSVLYNETKNKASDGEETSLQLLEGMCRKRVSRCKNGCQSNKEDVWVHDEWRID